MTFTQKEKFSLIYKAFRAAFPFTIPILTGFLFLGIAYGTYMTSLGFSWFYPAFMSIMIFAGSMEFVTATLLLANFDPLNAFLMTLIINARHLFYGLSMLNIYKNVGLKKWYLIFGLCDESFSINCTVTVPKNVDKGWFMFFVTLLNHFYWFLGSTLGGIFSSFIKFNTEGIDFVMTALFIVIFLEQWKKEKVHISALIGLFVPILCLIIFGNQSFIIPSMIGILLVLAILQKPLAKKGFYV